MRAEHLVQRLAFGHTRGLQPFDFLRNHAVFFLHGGILRVRDEADAAADGRQSLVGVVLPVQEPVF